MGDISQEKKTEKFCEVMKLPAGPAAAGLPYFSTWSPQFLKSDGTQDFGVRLSLQVQEK